MLMNHSEIQQLLPHREPILLIDTVSAMSPGHSISTTTKVDGEWDIFHGHFPGTPILPGTYLTECMAQAAALLLLSAEENKQKLPLLFQIQQMRFVRPVYPDDSLITTATLTATPGNQFYEFSVTVTVDEKTVAFGSITLCLK